MAFKAPLTNKPSCSPSSQHQLTVESYHTTVPAKNNQQLLRCYFRRAQGWSAQRQLGGFLGSHADPLPSTAQWGKWPTTIFSLPRESGSLTQANGV